jgi:hypothetical protein
MMDSWIQRLKSPEPGVRGPAALAIYREGRRAGDLAIRNWLHDSEFQSLLTGSPVVGLAVAHSTFDPIHSAFGGPPLAHVPPEQDAEEFEVHVKLDGEEAWLDIIRPRTSRPDGAIARFLARFGEGVQQVEYFVTDVDLAVRLLRARFGVRTVYPETRPGADSTRVNFILAGQPDGTRVLIELVERPASLSPAPVFVP